MRYLMMVIAIRNHKLGLANKHLFIININLIGQVPSHSRSVWANCYATIMAITFVAMQLPIKGKQYIIIYKKYSYTTISK